MRVFRVALGLHWPSPDLHSPKSPAIRQGWINDMLRRYPRERRLLTSIPPGLPSFCRQPIAEILRCALPQAILNSVARSACGAVHHAGAPTAQIAGDQGG
jgi:hypothetical protein